MPQTEIQPQRREDDKDEVDEWPDKSECLLRAHAVDLHRYHDRRHRRLDEGAEVAAKLRYVVMEIEVPADHSMDPELEQDERHDEGV
jgi:hypothetical protein